MTEEATVQAADTNEMILKAGNDGVTLRIRSNNPILLSLSMILTALMIGVLYLPNAGAYV